MIHQYEKGQLEEVLLEINKLLQQTKFTTGKSWKHMSL